MKALINWRLLVKVIAGVLFLIVSFVFYTARQHENEMFWLESPNSEQLSEELAAKEDSDIPPEEEITLVVDISGEVMVPSVYTLMGGARVYEAIELAGGLTEFADTRNTNLAAPLSDGMKLYIPSKDDLEEGMETTGEKPGSKYINGNISFGDNSADNASSKLININTADSTELQTLTGVGPSTASKIIAYRNEFGKFKMIEELMNVSGIGEKSFEKLKNAITAE